MRYLTLLIVLLSGRIITLGNEQDPIRFEHGIVMIQGAAGQDVAEVKTEDGVLKVTMLGYRAATREFRGREYSQIRFILFDGQSGDDVFRNDTSFPSIAYGGSGHDRLIGGSGWNHLDGGSGNDYLEVKPQSEKSVHRGQSRFTPSSGNDVVRYNKGDLILDGSGALELFENLNDAPQRRR